MRVSIGVLMPLHLNGESVGYTCSSLIEGMADQNFGVTVVTSRCTSSLPSVDVVQVLPNWARYVPYRGAKNRADRMLEDVFLSRVRRFRSRKRAAYLWPNASVDTIRELQRREVTVFREQFNCHTNTAKGFPDDAYRRLGLEPAHTISSETTGDERLTLDTVDYVLCPGPNVEVPLLENGVLPSKLLRTIYGWDPARLARSHLALLPNDGIKALFVCSICVRIVAHLLLDYWARAGSRAGWSLPAPWSRRSRINVPTCWPERTSSVSITRGTSEPCTVRPTSFSFRPSRKVAPWSSTKPVAADCRS